MDKFRLDKIKTRNLIKAQFGTYAAFARKLKISRQLLDRLLAYGSAQCAHRFSKHLGVDPKDLIK